MYTDGIISVLTTEGKRWVGRSVGVEAPPPGSTSDVFWDVVLLDSADFVEYLALSVIEASEFVLKLLNLFSRHVAQVLVLVHVLVPSP